MGSRKTRVLTVLQKFFSTKDLRETPLLLAFSGGPDSTALLHLVLSLERVLPKIHVVHVDHGWREVSSKEALSLQRKIESFDLPFHTTRLSGGCLGENEAREGRYAFFQKVYEEIGAQALLLAHHQEDQAETVLKRIFEGSFVDHLGGMREVSQQRGMVLWRPLLGVSKQVLLDFLEEELSAKETEVIVRDSTNLDSRFLRGRMRQELMPALSEMFGKEVVAPLCRFGREALLFTDYLEKKLEPLLRLGRDKEEIEIALVRALHPLEQLFFLKRWSEAHEVFASQETLLLILDAIESCFDKKVFCCRFGYFEINNNIIAIKRQFDYREEKAFTFNA